MYWEYFAHEEISDNSGFGKTLRAKRRNDNALVTLREILCENQTPANIKRALEEANILIQLRHPSIVDSATVFYEESNSAIYLEIEYFPLENSLEAVIMARIKSKKHQPFSEGQVMDWFTQVLVAVNFLHENGITHGAIKAKNVFFTAKGGLKITDFVVNRLRLSCRNTLVSPSSLEKLKYMPPEYFSGRYTSLTDSWMLGLLLYQMARFYLPFDTSKCKTVTDLVNLISTGKIQPFPEDYSRGLHDLMFDFLQRDMAKRVDVKDVVGRRFLSSYIAKSLTRKEDEGFAIELLMGEK